jgi:uncharacterized protein YjiK
MKVIFFLIFALLISLLLAFYFIKKNKTINHYKLEKPDFQQYLSKNLKEISGISHYVENQVICVNDEHGQLFIYDFNKQEIIDTLDFNTEADYEAVEFVNNIAYVLQSNGQIIGYNVLNKDIKTFDCHQDEVEEYEGLGYEPKTNCLLLATKEMKGDKTIYQFDLKNEILSEKFKISKKDISKNGKDGKEFKPSGIAVHPISEDIYVLASAGKKLLVFNSVGKIQFQYNLNKDQFPQPEGICFTPSGELIIASEGKNGQASISYFSFLPKN